MTEKMSYADEIFAWREKRYQKKPRTKLPWQETVETCQRVNDLVLPHSLRLKFPDDFQKSSTDNPCGDVLPANLFDLKFRYHTISGVATISGSGGTVILDHRTCKIEVARYFAGFAQPESCGQCAICRVGTLRMLEILNRISAGQGRVEDIETLEVLAERLYDATLCEVGKQAAVPVLGTLGYFREEYEEHILEHRCRAGRCGFDSLVR